MKRLLSVLCALLISLQSIGGVAFAAATVYIPDSSSSQYLPTVKIIAYTLSYDGSLVPDGVGSGTLIDSNGVVLTNNHVIQDAYDPSATYDAFQICLTKANQPSEPICNYTASFIARDATRDVGLLKIDKSDVQGNSVSFDFFLQPATTTPEVGEKVSVIGFPDTGGKTLTLTSGLISGFTTSGGTNYIKTDADISFGNSGGTAVTADGEFVGIPTFIIGSFSSESLGYLVPVAEITKWINDNKGSAVQRSEVAFSELKKQIKSYLDANQSGTYKNDYPPYEISSQDGWKFASSLEGAVNSEDFGLGVAADSISIFPEDTNENVPTSVSVYAAEYSYDVTLADVKAILEKLYGEGETDYIETELNGIPAILRSSSYVDWWYLNGESVYTDTYYIPYGTQIVGLTSSYVDSDIKNGHLDDIVKMFESFKLDMSLAVSNVVSEVSSKDPKITVKNPVSDFFLSDTSFQYDGVNYFGASFGKKADYGFYLSLDYNYFWGGNGDWESFKKSVLSDVVSFGELLGSGDAMVDGHKAFYYTTQYENAYTFEQTYSTMLYIKNDDDSYFNLYFSQGEKGYRENLGDVMKVVRAIKLSNDGKGKYVLPNFLGGSSKKLVDIENHLYESSIKSLNRAGAFSPVPLAFNPEGSLSRKDFVVWAVKTLGGSAADDFATFKDGYNGCQKDCYEDVDYGSDDAVYVEYARSKGAIGANGWFAANEQISLGAALKILAKLNDAKIWKAPDYVLWYIPYLYYGYSNYALPIGVDDVSHLLTRGQGAYMIDVVNVTPAEG